MHHVKSNKNLIFRVGWNKYWALFAPTPIPIPGVNKSPLVEGKQIKKKHNFDDFP